jgi:uncharacterized protein YutE (UPF0331/DUF86 family)
MNDVVLSKKTSIERCIQQAKSFYALESHLPFDKDHLRQDAICMNIQRACEQALDIAGHVVKTKKLGLPQDSRDAFRLLHDAGLITDQQFQALIAMVGFRNVLVHEYKKLDLQILESVIRDRLDRLIEFADTMVKAVD